MTTTVVRDTRRRSLATIGATLVALLAIGAGAPTGAGAQTETTPAQAAGSWLADQLVDGERFESEFDGVVFPDYGLTADTVVALAAAGVADGFAASATEWLGTSEVTTGYAGDGDESTSSGGLAKLAIVAQTRGLDARSWGEDDVDLIQRLLDIEDANGRFVDNPDFGNDFKTFSHAFVVVALARQDGVEVSDASLDLLLSSQCDDGGFSGTLAPQECTSTVDATATALMGLIAVDRDDDAEEIDDAVSYLLDLQGDDGNLGNANATGLAAYVLGLAGETAAAQDGASFLQSLQLDCDDPEEHRGAVDVDGGEFDAGSATRATSQAIMGLSGEGYLGASAAAATTEQPRLGCTEDTTSTTSTTTAPTSTSEPEVESDAASPAATPTRANPNFTG